MYVFQPEAAGTVVALTGKAVARAPDGSLRMLGVGDRVDADEVVLTAERGQLGFSPEAPSRLLAAYSTASPKLLSLPDSPAVRGFPAAQAEPAPPVSRGTALSTAAPKVVVLPDEASGAPREPAQPTPEPPVFQRVAALSVAQPKALGAARAEPPSEAPVLQEAGPSALQGALRLDGGGSAESGGASLALANAFASTAAEPPVRSLGRHGGPVDRLAPLADANRSVVTPEDTAVAIALNGRDPDGSVAWVFIVKVPTGGLLYRPDGEPIADRSALDPADARQLVFIPAPNFHGDPGPLQYMVEDASGKLSAVATLTISVTPVNDAPLPGTTLTGPDLTALPDADIHHLAGTPDYQWRTAADTPVFGRVRATDVDLDPLVFSASTPPAHGQVLVAADGSFVYTPELSWRGADRFVVTVDDGRGGQAVSTVFIDVTAPGAAPASVTPADVAAQALPLDNALRFDEIFGRAPVERAATHQVRSDSDVDADVLQLSALLVGHLPVVPAQREAPTELRLDLGLDWGLRGNGLDGLKDPWLPTLY